MDRVGKRAMVLLEKEDVGFEFEANRANGAFELPGGNPPMVDTRLHSLFSKHEKQLFLPGPKPKACWRTTSAAPVSVGQTRDQFYVCDRNTRQK